MRLAKLCDAPEELTDENGHRIALREKIGRVRQDYVELLLAEKLQPELLDKNAARKPINALHQNRADICPGTYSQALRIRGGPPGDRCR